MWNDGLGRSLGAFRSQSVELRGADLLLSCPAMPSLPLEYSPLLFVETTESPSVRMISNSNAYIVVYAWLVQSLYSQCVFGKLRRRMLHLVRYDSSVDAVAKSEWWIEMLMVY